MTTVQTVLGPVDVGDLGVTLVHEHVAISYPGDDLDPSYSYTKEACLDVAVERMRRLQEHDVRTFVDPCPIDLGRDPVLLAEVAKRSGMNIVCSTGFYHEHIGIPYYWRVRSVDEIAAFYLHEVENGIGSSGVKPGCIKIASGDPPSDLDRKIIEAAAIAAERSGLPVISHCENAVGGDVQQEILSSKGVDIERCVIGHQGQAPSADQHVAIAERGSIVGFDRIGLEILAPDEHQADCIKAVVDAGHADRIALSQDHMCCLRSPKFPYPVPPGMEEVFEQALPVVYDQIFGRPHTFMFTDFLPRLEKRGIDRKTIDAMLTATPARLFGG
jgi:phosphotriesterase-related protein